MQCREAVKYKTLQQWQYSKWYHYRHHHINPQEFRTSFKLTTSPSHNLSTSTNHVQTLYAQNYIYNFVGWLIFLRYPFSPIVSSYGSILAVQDFFLQLGSVWLQNKKTRSLWDTSTEQRQAKIIIKSDKSTEVDLFFRLYYKSEEYYSGWYSVPCLVDKVHCTSQVNLEGKVLRKKNLDKQARSINWQNAFTVLSPAWNNAERNRDGKSADSCNKICFSLFLFPTVGPKFFLVETNQKNISSCDERTFVLLEKLQWLCSVQSKTTKCYVLIIET